MRRRRPYDLAVLGGGTAGLVAAHGAAGLGARVVLIERHEQTGGDCLWTGCVPSKSLIAAAELAHRMRRADAIGLAPVEPEIDFAQVMAHVHGARRRIEPQDSVERLRASGVDVVHGAARFAGPGQVVVDDRHALSFRAALIATGSSPIIPPIDRLQDAHPLTNETVWDLRELPRRLVVLGGGPVGCELAQAFARLGSDVALVEMAAGLLGKEEPEAQALIAERLRGEGVDVRIATEALRVEGLAGESGRLVVERDGQEGSLPFDRILVATGRRPQTADLGLETIGVEVDDQGAVEVDATLRTTAKRIFAAGDVTGSLPFTHVAGHHGRTVVGNALFHIRRSFTTDAVPWVTFTDPEVGRVGLTEQQARRRFGDRVAIAHQCYEDLDRAVTAGLPYGFAKLVGGPRGRLVGATVAAPAGGEAIAGLAMRVAAGDAIGDLSRQVHAYPTFAEGPARAADDHLRTRWLTPSVRRFTRPVLGLLRAVDGGSS
ncbi:MAG TPA: FAD-dependent oxidoreductase [Thermoleophilaceae bacterium]|nr:FAD-dependent oxidoreductase [Thermoleophilaceae bacterium]